VLTKPINSRIVADSEAVVRVKTHFH